MEENEREGMVKQILLLHLTCCWWWREEWMKIQEKGMIKKYTTPPYNFLLVVEMWLEENERGNA